MAGSNVVKSVLVELAKHVPNNQRKQFRKFMELNKEYKKRLNKYPEKLPRIDWDYYRLNVRFEAIKMVDEFEKKYEELNKVFDDRVKLDTKKYYNELEKQRTVVQAQIKQFIVESNERVKAYEAEIQRLCTMKPYSSMTMEEFINLRPECSNYIPHQRKPLFWPHDPDEQTPGPVDLMITDGKGGGGRGGGGGAGGKHPIKPGDIKGDTASFEFKEVETKSTQDKQEATTKADVPEKSLQAETKQEVTSKKIEEPKPHIDKPASKEEKQKLDPCGLIEKQDKQEKTETATFSKEEKPRKVETPTEPRKKPHPCDLVKGTRESTTKGDVTCETAPKGPYKDEVKRTCVFVDPCNIGFGERVTAKVEKPIPKTEPKPQPVEAKKTQPPEIVKKKPESDKDACKSAAKKEQPKPTEPKKTHPCDVVKKKADPNEEICKAAATKGQYKDAKGTCVFVDPCNVGVGVGVPAKAAPKTEPKPQPIEPKKTQSCEMAKKKPDPDKDSCKSATKKEQSQPIETNKTHPCEAIMKKPDSDKDPCKSSPKKEQSQPKEAKKTHPCEAILKKPDSDKDPCKSSPKKEQSQPKEAKKTNPCDVVKKKAEPDKDPCKSVAKKEQSQPKEAKKTNPCEDVKKKAEPDKDQCKVAAKKEQSQPKEAKKTNPCEVVKKRTDPNEEICKGAATKGRSKDEKGVCVFIDPCNVGFGAGIKSDPHKPVVEKVATKTEPKPQSKEPKKAQPCEVIQKKPDSVVDPCKAAAKKEQSQPKESNKTNPCDVVKKKAEPDKDPCKSVAKKEQSQPKEAKKTNPCEDVKKKAEPDKDPCKVAAKKEQSQPKEAKNTNPCEDVKKKADIEQDPCKSAAKKEQSKDGCAAADSKTTTIVNPCNWQPVRPKRVRSQTIKDKDSCTMVFADPKKAKSDCSKEDKKKQNKSCGALPYYNPFRSEAENRKNEEKMCEESEEDDPCASDNIEEDYYNPCKDDKDDECE